VNCGPLEANRLRVSCLLPVVTLSLLAQLLKLCPSLSIGVDERDAGDTREASRRRRKFYGRRLVNQLQRDVGKLIDHHVMDAFSYFTFEIGGRARPWHSGPFGHCCHSSRCFLLFQINQGLSPKRIIAKGQKS
jgi:hypothetical protein